MLIRDAQGPLCPRSMLEPVAPEHALRVRLLDVFYNAADKDDDGELASEPLARAYGAAAYGDAGSSDRMRLYCDSAYAADVRVTVEAWYFHCPVCGLFLPAGRLGR